MIEYSIRSLPGYPDPILMSEYSRLYFYFKRLDWILLQLRDGKRKVKAPIVSEYYTNHQHSSSNIPALEKAKEQIEERGRILWIQIEESAMENFL